MSALAQWTLDAHDGAVGDELTADHLGSPERLVGVNWSNGGRERRRTL